MAVDDEEGRRVFDGHLDRESGLFIEPDGKEVACDPDQEPCAPDDFSNDPDVRRNGIPGTVDDQPLSMGQQTPDAADEHIVAEGAVKPSGESLEKRDRGEETGRDDTRELWDDQSELVEEDDHDAVNLRGFSDEDAEEVFDEMGDQVQEPLPDFPNGVSATGEWSAPEHGGFPERKD